jgi:dual specificity tyrosine-phosphorylation-regulated kinase 2/3/4
MSVNLYELIKSNGYYGLPLDLIRRISLQILNALYFIHRNLIIHADLKPENILLKEAKKSGIRVIDFGSSCYEKETIYTYIQSRYYRAP